LAEKGLLKWVVVLGRQLLTLKWVERIPVQRDVDAVLRPMVTELYGSACAADRLTTFKAQCLGIAIALLGFGLVIVLLAGLGPVELVYVLVFSVLCGLMPVFDLKKKVEERRYLLKRGLPDFISRLVLLVEAGMTLSRGFEIAARNVEKNSPLFYEISKTCNEMNNGVTESQAYEQLAVRCRIIEVARFSSMLIQNLRKGNSELASLLRMVSSECWNARKAHAKKRGEEAAAKMLIPVSLLLIAVLIVTAGPALASLLNVNTVQMGR